MTSTTAYAAILVMGVSGAGKTTIGRLLAERLRWRFIDGDDLHPKSNIRKMESGTPLDDGDRRPWLEEVKKALDGCLENAEPAVLTCSALKSCYRQWLDVPRPRVALVHLTGGEQLLAARLKRRQDHFMPPSLLRDQLETLEPPDPPALVLDVRSSPAALCSTVLRTFKLE